MNQLDFLYSRASNWFTSYLQSDRAMMRILVVLSPVNRDVVMLPRQIDSNCSGVPERLEATISELSEVRKESVLHQVVPYSTMSVEILSA